MDSLGTRPPYTDDEIELIDILRILWKRRLLIGVLVFLSVLAAFAVVQLKYPKIKTAVCQISLSFPGIENHKNPDGSAFEKSDIILPRVIAVAQDDLVKTFGDEHAETLHDILQVIEIIEVIPEEIFNKIKEAEKDNKEFPYRATTFNVRAYSQNLTDVGDDLMAAVPLAVVTSYKRYFEERYGLEPLVKIEFPENFVETNEFYDVVNVFMTYSNKLLAFLNRKIESAGYFKSGTSGYTFVDVKNEVDLLQDVHIKPLQAIVTNRRMTREMDALVSQLENQIRGLEATKQKKELAADVSRTLLKEMNKESRAGGVPQRALTESMAAGITLESGLYDEIRKNDYRSFLLKSIIDAEVEAINSAVDIETLKKEIEKIRKEEKDETRTEAVVVRMNRVKDYLIRYSRMADEINAEYLTRKIKNSITVIRSPLVETKREKNIRLILALALFGSLFMAVFIAFIYEYISNHTAPRPPGGRGLPEGLIASESNRAADQR
ncbi:hypothetical protein JCM14469_19970 [Desulfatiferula olefinivorans]